jgi:hypothetical protein
MQNVFGVLDEDEDNNDSTNTVATQMAALTPWSQLITSMAANTLQHRITCTNRWPINKLSYMPTSTKSWSSW